MSRIGLGREQLRSPLARRLIVAIVLVSSAITLAFTGIQLYGEYRGELIEIENDFRQIERVHLKSLSSSLWSTNQGDLQLQLDGIVRVPNLEYVTVREGGKLWAQAGWRVSENVVERRFAMTHVHQGRTLALGTLTVVAGLDAIYRKLIVRAFVVLASNALKTFLVAGFALFFFHRLVNRHLADIAQHLHGLDPGKRASPLVLARAAKARPDELDEVVAATNFLQEKGYSTLAALRESQQTLRLISETIDEVFWMLDLAVDKNFYISSGYERVWGRTRASLQENPRFFLDAVHPEDLDRVRADLENQKSGQPFDHEYRIIRPDGTIRWIWDRGYPLRDGTGKVTHYAGVAQDITERKQALDELVRQKVLLAAMSRRNLALQEEERRAVARELHDEIGQDLTAVKIHLQAMAPACQGCDKSLAVGNMDEALLIVAKILEQVRGLSLNLRPMQLDDLGLTVALSSLVARVAATAGWIAHFDEDLAAERLDPDVELACYRVAQETLTNAMRHACASEVWITLRRSDHVLRLTVRDNGRGFDSASARSATGTPHLGLLGMEERAKNAAGQFEIRTSAGEGTEVRASFPIVTADADSAALA